MTACVMMLYKFYEMYYYNNLQEDVNRVVIKQLPLRMGKIHELHQSRTDDIPDKTIFPGRLKIFHRLHTLLTTQL